ncbi:hypothetical protein GCM10017710_02470 [Arthrobacter ramosus]
MSAVPKREGKPGFDVELFHERQKGLSLREGGQRLTGQQVRGGLHERPNARPVELLELALGEDVVALILGTVREIGAIGPTDPAISKGPASGFSAKYSPRASSAKRTLNATSSKASASAMPRRENPCGSA